MRVDRPVEDQHELAPAEHEPLEKRRELLLGVEKQLEHLEIALKAFRVSEKLPEQLVELLVGLSASTTAVDGQLDHLEVVIAGRGVDCQKNRVKAQRIADEVGKLRQVVLEFARAFDPRKLKRALEGLGADGRRIILVMASTRAAIMLMVVPVAAAVTLVVMTVAMAIRAMRIPPRRAAQHERHDADGSELPKNSAAPVIGHALNHIVA